MGGASVINCCYDARGIGVSLRVTGILDGDPSYAALAEKPAEKA
jgi:hypothetical protein